MGQKTQGETRTIKGIYLHSRAISEDNAGDWARVLKEHGLNAVVINVKNVHGEVTYSSEVDLAAEIGAVTDRLNFEDIINRPTVKGFTSLLD
mgnify:CR=1 FL=1